MKEAIFYAVVRRYGWRIVAVTSVKGEGYRQHWYGRDMPDGISTHGKRSELSVECPTYEMACSLINELKLIAKHFEELRDPLQIQINTLYDKERNKITEALENARSAL